MQNHALNRLVIPVFLLFILLLLAVVPVSAQDDDPSAELTRSAASVYAPIGINGLIVGINVTDEVDGSCFSRSISVSDRPDVWRCTGSDNAIYDPCFIGFSDPTTLACANDPWSANVVMLTLTEDLPDEPVPTNQLDIYTTVPWALELNNGMQCTLLSGATTGIAGMRLNYGCSDDGENSVIGDVDRTDSIWRVFFYNSMRSISLDQVGVVKAWF